MRSRLRFISPEGAEQLPRLCALVDFDDAEIVIALKEVEHRPIIEQRFPEVADRVRYWHVRDIEFVDPSIALPLTEGRVRELVSTLE
jgi:protein-tyrosine phosphatase